ncbi:MAG: sulfite exporter TauE/SafE family protein, partial [Parvularcula sp.]|nr:sulfite exporter TauE/SafE family protein [Parvularcula sp.]
MIDVLPFVVIGFFAQLIDGALGMAFGVISTTLLVGLAGVPPASASASVHLAEVFTTGASGASHAFLRNVDWKLFARLALPGVLGGVIGAFVISGIDAGAARPFIMLYLAGIGIVLLYRAWRYPPQKFEDPRLVAPIAAAGGFLDAAGGGGWGPVVTSNLLIQGANPRKTIGTVNTTEFVLTLSVSITFLSTIGFEAFTKATLGLLIGGVIAAPLGAFVARMIKPRALLLFVGT